MQIMTKFIQDAAVSTAKIIDNAVTGAKIRLGNAEWLKARNAANSADVNLMRVNSSDRIEFDTIPQVGADASANNDLVRYSQVNSIVGNYIPTSQKGANNGVATLDAGGKVPAGQLPSSVMEYKGTWSAATNTPTLADGTGDAGDVYVCNAAGSVDFGSGSITFAVGDWAMYNGTVWQKSINSNAVVSVNGQTGVVSLIKSDVGLGNVPNTDATNPANIVWTSSYRSVTDTEKSTWNGKQGALGYTAEDVANKSTSTSLGTSNTLYPTQGAVKSYVDTAVSTASKPWNKETKTLLAQDITNQYVDMAQVCIANSIDFMVDGLIMAEGVDYTVSLTGGSGGKTRITFAGDLATAGASALVATDVLYIKYQY